MIPRTAKVGKQKPWTLEELAFGLEQFYAEHKRYPTAPEVDLYQFLPSARTIERRFGGLVELRQQLKLNSQPDFRSGKYSSERASRINSRAHKVENTVYRFLVKKFGIEFVHREYFFVDDRRTRADFFVYDTEGGFCVDVFYPNSRRNVSGCLNSKLSKYHAEYMRQYPVIFLEMNEDISQVILDVLVSKKKKRLSVEQHLMSWESFKRFCQVRNPLSVV